MGRREFGAARPAAGSDVQSVFLFEAITGGSELPLSEGLLREGAAMVRSLAEDFLDIGCIHVHTLRRAELGSLELRGCSIVDVLDAEHEHREFDRLCRDSTWTCIIAPELDGCLLRLTQRAEQLGARLLSPNSGLIRIASDKHETCELLRSQRIPAPNGRLLNENSGPDEFRRHVESSSWPAPDRPLVLKRCDGAGSVDIALMAAGSNPSQSLLPTEPPARCRWRVEEFIPGMPASVAVLCGPQLYGPQLYGPQPYGPQRCIALPAARQRLAPGGQFTYLGGELPLPQPLRDRAERLALSAIRALPPAVGYIGVDLVLGDDPTGLGDAVIEVNPRLTTSYVGLRALAETNLAAAMLALVGGKRVELSFRPGALEFDADGTVRPRRAS